MQAAAPGPSLERLTNEAARDGAPPASGIAFWPTPTAPLKLRFEDEEGEHHQHI
jgi:hypothetical protein